MSTCQAQLCDTEQRLQRPNQYSSPIGCWSEEWVQQSLLTSLFRFNARCKHGGSHLCGSNNQEPFGDYIQMETHTKHTGYRITHRCYHYCRVLFPKLHDSSTSRGVRRCQTDRDQNLREEPTRALFERPPLACCSKDKRERAHPLYCTWQVCR